MATSNEIFIDSQLNFYVLFTSVHLLCCSDSHSVMDKKRETKRDKRSSFFKEKPKYKSVHYNVLILITMSTYTKQIFDKREDAL